MPTKKYSKSKHITSKDVAAIAGVSQSTVSRVLSPDTEASSFISDETAEKVKEAAKKLGYSPNPIARALRGQSTNLIGLVVREIADPFFAGFIELLSKKVRESGLNMVLGHVHSDPSEALEMTHVLDSRQCDGIFFLGDLRNDEKAIEQILSEHHPVVALCRGRTVASLPTVNVDNRAGIHMLIEYLLDIGHKNLVFVDGGWFGDIHERRIEFLNYMEKKEGIEFTWVQGRDNSAEGGYNAMMEISKFSKVPTAVLASDDAMATGLLKAASDLDLKIPDEISITGFDDIDCAAYTIPSLTTIRQPIVKMADIALELLQMQIEKIPIPQNKLFRQVQPELIIRQSSGPHVN